MKTVPKNWSTATMALILVVTKVVQGFQLPESISSALVYKPHQRLRVYASDLYEDPLNPRLTYSAKFSDYFEDELSKANAEPTFLQKLFKENFYNTSFEVCALLKQLNFAMNEYCKQLWHKNISSPGFLSKPLYYKLHVDNYPVSLSSNFTSSVYSRRNAHGKFAIPTAIRIKGSNKTGDVESLIVFNHLRFVVNTVLIDPAPKIRDKNTDKEKAEKIAISHIEVIPMSLRQKRSEQKGSPHVTNCKYGENIVNGMDAMRLPELKPVIFKESDHEVRYTYDVVYKRRKSLAILTTFDDLQKSTTILEVNILISAIIITVLLAAIVQIIRVTLKRVVDDAPIEREEEEMVLVTDRRGVPVAAPQPSKKPHPSIHLKNIKNDVFRGPKWPRVFSILMGLGLQFAIALLATAVSLIFFFKSHQHRGRILTVLVVFYMLSGTILGYSSSRFYLNFNGRNWLSMALITSFLIPSLMVFSVCSINFILWIENSYFSITFSELVWIPFYWFCTFVPQVYIGSYLGFNSKKSANPCSVSLVARPVERIPWYLQTGGVEMVGGCLPFIVFYFTAYLVFYGIWINDAYSMVSVHMLLISTLLYLITCSLVGIVTAFVCFYHEQHDWWWTCFQSAGGTGCWFFFIHTSSWLAQLFSTNQKSASELAIFTSINLIISMFVYFMSGAVSSLAASYFVRHLYLRLKLD